MTGAKGLTAQERRLADVAERVDRGRAALFERGLAFPGGDDLRHAELVGLAMLRKWLEDHEDQIHNGNLEVEERLALRWLDAWIDAGAAQLPRELWRP